MDWRVYAGLVILGFSVCAVLMKVSEEHISPAAAIVVFSVAMLLAASGFFLYQTSTQAEVIRYTWKGVAIMGVAGIANTVGDLSLILALRHGAPLAILSPLVDAGTVLATIAMAFLLLRETINLQQFAGICLCIAGIILTLRA